VPHEVMIAIDILSVNSTYKYIDSKGFIVQVYTK